MNKAWRLGIPQWNLMPPTTSADVFLKLELDFAKAVTPKEARLESIKNTGGFGFEQCAAVILAAGRSTRMKSKLPKPLHAVCGKPMSRHVVDACREAGVNECVVV